MSQRGVWGLPMFVLVGVALVAAYFGIRDAVRRPAGPTGAGSPAGATSDERTDAGAPVSALREPAGGAGSRSENASARDVVPAALPEPAHRRVQGRIDPGSHPLEEFSVALLAAPYDRPRNGPVPSVTPDAKGRFALDAEEDGPHALVVCASVHAGGDLRPLTRFVEVSAGPPLDVGLLELGPGASVAGTVVDAAGLPAPGAWVLGHPSRVRGPNLAVGSTLLVWSGSGFELSSLRARADPDGHFRATGLAPLDYRLGARKSAPKQDGVPWATIGQVAERAEVTAPAEGVVLVVRGVPVLFRVTGAGRPVRAQLLHADWEDSYWCRSTNDEGLIRFDVALDEDLEIEFSAPGFAPRTEVFRPEDLARTREIAVDLEPGPPPAELAIRFGAEVAAALGDRPVDVMAYDLDRLPDEWRESIGIGRPIGDRGPPTVTMLPGAGGVAQAVRANFRIVVGPLPPGHWLVRLVPRATSPEDLGPPWIEEPFDVVLEPGQRTWVDWHPRIGGRIRLEVTGTPAGAVQLVLIGPGGRIVQPGYWIDEPEGRGQSASPAIPGASNSMTPLPPGPYHLEVRVRGATLAPIPFEVRPGETTRVAADVAGLGR